MTDCAPEPPGMTEAGEKVTVAPGGKPLAVRATPWANVPPVDET